ncbi:MULTISPECIES: nickel ABC transporter permease subunit NikB [Pseudomonas]|jgi:nickel transport system permease protein|uniref:Nickel ABC transporter permease subunit NikB n=1 Tax=Pseudomonas lundensis TaxID=86185 RepID=A0ABX4GH46_9PSED|nr:MULTISPECIES: nickel ABC transporter permease subunit NikB [Pseudomonas]AOZ14853.1 nickel ABC transporter permease subunit NikB [Pseudomonas lundensis]MBM1181305.1 nickel ABC transporter permease subunit NikB [Pseudomonas lundensis]MBM1186254.1 nickel ABC transporter permease subunit NikB [Pseudomonas lundensis]NLU01754.1 nickel ABC transporter permease subunit NikB [Pseudomonas lundensis]NMZ53293.1 nickel ABC transporter permease subunit NikB [Pseudomonas lundensis]
MLRYIALRLILLVPVLLGVSLIVFLLLHMGNGDPALDYLRLSQIPPTDSALAEARQALGLDRPLPEQYLSWVWNALHLDFGVSYITGRPVLDDVLYYLPATLQLGALALLVTLALSIPLGLAAARWQGKWPDHVVRFVTFIGVSMPNFWLAFLLIALLSLWLGWLPPMGRGGPAHLVMPVLAIALMSMSINARLLRASLLDVRQHRHVFYARARGLNERRVWRDHILRNAWMPLVTATGMHIGELLGGALVIETIFAWPGVGRFAVSAVLNRDFPVMQCFTLLLTTLLVLCNLVVDICYAWLDPRTRLAGVMA